MSYEITDTKKTRAYVDLDAIAHNYNYTKALVGTRVICVVKADAYGHGANAVAKRLQSEGADFFAVATIDEALELRQSGIKGGIVILGYVLPCCIHLAAENDISIALASYDAAKAIDELKLEKTVKVHIKLNTGMNRTGFNVSHGIIPKELCDTAELIKRSKNIRVEGLFSHFAKAEDDEEFSKTQFEAYGKAKQALSELGIHPEICHICNSAGLLSYPEMRMDAVRLGISLYGCSTTDRNYLPVMSFKTVIVDIHELEIGDGVSYGLTFRADRKMKMAVIGAGYADGLKRCLSGGKGCVLCHGKKLPIIGRVCMDMAMIDVSEISDVKVGDDVVIWGQDGDEFLSCDEQADNAETISYELMCSVSKRIPRIYTEK